MDGFFKTVIFMVLVFATVVLAEDYEVGDDAKWSRPSDLEFYNTWAAGKTFLVGDVLEFEFDAERHDVAIVTADEYENCEKETPLSLIKTSPAKIMLNDTGPQYFICTSGDHCRFGQKLTVNVVDDASGPGGHSAGATPPAPGGATTPAPGGAATTPTSGGATTPASSSGGGATTPAPSGATAPGAEGTSPPTPGAGTTGPTGSSETTTPAPAESTASSLGGGASFMVAFVSAVVALF